MSETKFVKSLLKDLRGLPGTWWEKIAQRSQGGTPDVIGCVKCEECGDGKFHAYEAKTDTGKVSKLQTETMYRISEAGGIVRVVRPEEADELLESLQKPRCR